MNTSSENSDTKEILEYLKSLDKRIGRLESRSSYDDYEDQETAPEETAPVNKERDSDRWEFQIGQFWLTRVGIVVFAVGIVLLLTFPYPTLPGFLPSLTGYILVGGILAIANYWKKSFSYFARYLLGGGLVLLYFTTLRLAFFGANPVITSMPLELALLSIVVIINLIVALKNNSVYITALSLTMGFITGLVGDSAYFQFIVSAILAAVAVYYSLNKSWPRLMLFAIFATYFFHILWFANNPVMGHDVKLVFTPHINLLFLLLYGVIFAVGTLLRGQETSENNSVVITGFLNSAGSYGLLLFLTLLEMPAHFGLFHFTASIIYLAVSVVFWMRLESKYSTFFYAMLGYGALSVAIISQSPLPEFFIWLCLQSLLVISTAIWFKSKFIVVANFFIYLVIFIAYLALAQHITAISLVYGVVALASARIMNWQSARLELKTESMRISYLVTAFIIIPYSLFSIVASDYVALSWMGAVLFYYIMSRILNSTKYRLMALGTLLLSVAYVFIVGITKLEPVYRIISFLALGLALLVISLIYFRISSKRRAAAKKE